MKNFKKAVVRLLAVCIAITLCNIPCVALGEEEASVTAVTIVGANYRLPNEVNGKAVAWDTNAVNTFVAGNQYHTGTDSDGAAVNLTLKVMETQTIFSENIESYEVGTAKRPVLVDGKGLQLGAYNAETNNVYVDAIDGFKAVKVSSVSSWSNKVVLGSSAYTGDFAASMKLKVISKQGLNDNYLMQIRMGMDDSYSANMVGGFYLKNVKDSEGLYVAGYDGSANAIGNTKLSDVVAEKITNEKNEEIGYITKWIDVQLIYNSKEKTYDIYVDNTLVIENMKMKEKAAEETGIRSIYFADRNSTGNVTTYVDKIYIKKLVDAQAYKTLIYEDMEKFKAYTDETAATAARPTLVGATADATTATTGLAFGAYKTGNEIYIKNVEGNNVSYISGKSSWSNELALGQTLSGAFKVNAKVQLSVNNIASAQNFFALVLNDEDDESAGGIAFTYSSNKFYVKTYTQAGKSATDFDATGAKQYIKTTSSTANDITSEKTEWFDVCFDFGNDNTYDLYINDILVYDNVPAYHGVSTKAAAVTSINFASRTNSGTGTFMVDDIKVTVPYTSGAGKQLLIAGDSIAAGYNLNSDTRGWGQVIGERLQNITVNNNAVAGQYTRSFYENNVNAESVKINRFDELMWEANPCDILVLSFGHNERSRVTDGEYTMDDYKKYLAKCISKAKAYGVTTILATSIAEAYFDGENVSEERTKYTVQIKDFADAMKAFAAENNVPVIDLYAKTKALLTNIGEGSADNYYVADKTHLLEKGAKTVAKYLTEGFAATPLAPYVKTDLVDGGVQLEATLSDGIMVVNNNDINYAAAKLIKAEYNGERLDKAEIIDAALEAGGTFSKEITVTEGNTARVFLFENIENIMPLANAADVK